MLSLLHLFFASLALAQAVPSGVPQLGTNPFGTTAASSITTPSFLTGSGATFSLSSGDRNALNQNKFYPLYRNGSPYRVGDQSGDTVTKWARCWGITAVDVSGNGFQLISATASFAFDSTSITGGVFQGGATTKFPYMTTSGTAYLAHPGTYSFGPGTYPGFQAGATTVYNLHMDCTEE